MTECGNRESANSTSRLSHPFRPYDILMGRGSGPNRWEGNRRFRDLVLTVFQSYANLQSRDDGDVASFSALDPFIKNELAHRVLTAIQNENGRFLQKLKKSDWEKDKTNCPTCIIIFDESEGTCESMGAFVYVEASTKKAMGKIKQTLRFLSDQKRARQSKKLDLQRKISNGSVRPTSTTSAMGDSLCSAASSDAPSQSRLPHLMDLRHSAAQSPEGVRISPLTTTAPVSLQALMPPMPPAAFPLTRSSNVLVPLMETLLGTGLSPARALSLLNLGPGLPAEAIRMNFQRSLMLERELLVSTFKSVSIAEEFLRKRLVATSSQQLLGRLSNEDALLLTQLLPAAVPSPSMSNSCATKSTIQSRP